MHIYECQIWGTSLISTERVTYLDFYIHVHQLSFPALWLEVSQTGHVISLYYDKLFIYVNSCFVYIVYIVYIVYKKSDNHKVRNLQFTGNHRKPKKSKFQVAQNCLPCLQPLQS